LQAKSPSKDARAAHDPKPGPPTRRRVVTVVSRAGGHGRQLTLAAKLERAGRHDDALAIYRKLAKASPDSSDVLMYHGRCLALADRPQQAIRPLEAALKLRPDDVRILLLLGEARRELGGGGAAECFERVLAQQPDHHLAQARLGQVLADTGRAEEGIARLRQAVAAEPENPLYRLLLGNALVADRRFDEAKAAFKQLTAIKGRVDGHLGLARLAETLGKFEDSVCHLEQARRKAPGHVDVLGQLIKHRKAATPPAVLEQARRLAERADLPGRQRAQLHFMLGQAADAAGDHEIAFDHLAAGNALRRRNLGDTGQFYDQNIIANWFDGLIARYDAAFFARHRERGSPSELPVFVVGMPRSGTTLTEQILAGHARVFGAGELGHLEKIAARLAATGRKGDLIDPDVPAERLAAAADEYLAALRKLAPDADRVVDKNPSNFAFLGLIAALFPRARLIHCRRDPRDVGLSCFMQNFRAGKPWSYDLRDMAHYYRQYHRLMEHWRGVLPIAILDVPYEAVVEDLEGWARRLIEFCGLEWRAKVLDFHRLDRPVFTASVRQVRQPIYKGSVGKWRNYRRQLAPFIAGIEDLLD
jgi:tetratricopeptide (TPR) repeat protein